MFYFTSKNVCICWKCESITLHISNKLTLIFLTLPVILNQITYQPFVNKSKLFFCRSVKWYQYQLMPSKIDMAAKWSIRFLKPLNTQTSVMFVLKRLWIHNNYLAKILNAKAASRSKLIEDMQTNFLWQNFQAVNPHVKPLQFRRSCVDCMKKFNKIDDVETLFF